MRYRPQSHGNAFRVRYVQLLNYPHLRVTTTKFQPQPLLLLSCNYKPIISHVLHLEHVLNTSTPSPAIYFSQKYSKQPLPYLSLGEQQVRTLSKMKWILK